MNQLPCQNCGHDFTPKDKGYNAKYCSKKCRNKAAALRLPKAIKQSQRKRSYIRIKDNPERYATHLSQGRSSAKVVRSWLAEYKTERGCIDCGYNKHAAALQIDHNGPKTATISDLRSSKERIIAEIESGKCVVRCAVCHAVKTWAGKNGIKYEPSMARKSC